MGLYNHWPWTNFHELNLEWILNLMEDLSNKVDNFVLLNAIKYADPIQWNITTQYEKNTVVIEPNSGDAYLSIQPVPAGVAITNTDYWTEIFSLSTIITTINKNLTTHQDEGPTATFNSAAGDWILWNDALYVVTSAINAGDAYTIGSNIEAKSVEDLVKSYIALLSSAIDDVVADIGDLNNLTTTDKSNLVSAINEIVTNIGDLTSLHTTDKSSVVDSINEVYDQLAQEIQDRIDGDDALNGRIDNLRTGLYVNVKDYGAVGDGITDDSAAIQACINNENYIYFPAGTYVCKLVNLKSHIKILGTKDSILQLAPNLTSADIIGDVSTGLFNVDYCCIFKADNLTDIEIDGITFDGAPDNRSGQHINADLLWMYQCNHVKVHNVYVHHALNSMLHFYDCKFIEVFDSYLSYSGMAVELYPLETTKGGDNILLHYNCSNCQIHHVISDHAHNINFELEGRGLSSWDYASSIKMVTIDSCIARDSRGHGFLFLNCQGVSATNCIAAGSSLYNGFEFLGGTNNVLSNCIGINNYRFNLTLTDESNAGASGYPAPEYVRVSNFLSSGSEGVELLNATHITLDGIIIRNKNQANLSNYGLWIYGANNNEINNVKLVHTALQTEGIHIQGTNFNTLTNISGTANTYLIGIASSTRIITNIINARYGARAFDLTGNYSRIILNNVTEVNTSGDITTTYGSDTAVTINNASILT